MQHSISVLWIMAWRRLFGLDCVTFRGWHEEDKSTDADTGPFIVHWTVLRLATGPAVKSEGRRKNSDEKKEARRGRIGHIHIHTKLYLMFTYELKSLTMHACSLEDGFTNELFEEISAGENKWKKRKTNYMRPQAASQIPDERWNTEREEPDKNTNKDPVVGKKGADSWRTAEGEAYNQPRVACDENPICHTELRSLGAYESFRRLPAPQAKVNTRWGGRTTLKITTRLLLLSTREAWLKRRYICLFNSHSQGWTQFCDQTATGEKNKWNGDSTHTHTQTYSLNVATAVVTSEDGLQYGGC